MPPLSHSTRLLLHAVTVKRHYHKKESTSIEEMTRMERRTYFKAWRVAKKEKVKKHNSSYWQRRAEKRMKEACMAHPQNKGDIFGGVTWDYSLHKVGINCEFVRYRSVLRCH